MGWRPRSSSWTAAQFAVSGPSEILAARSRGQDVVIVANLYAGLAGSVVLSKSVAAGLKVKPDAPVADRLRTLDGLLIAEPSATSALLGPINTAAEQVGAHIRFTYMAQGTMPAALENNAIQGMVASFPFAGTPILRGTGLLWINGPGGELPQDVLPSSSSCVQATAAYAKANPAVIGQLRQSIEDIASFVAKDPAAAKRALAAAYSQLSAQEVDLAFDQQWRNWTKPFLTVANMRQELKLLMASSKLPGLEKLDPAAALLPLS
jgi:ABC-type nitrate/sulfonate/bicarbonate transport system substrate-binding protein